MSDTYRFNTVFLSFWGVGSGSHFLIEWIRSHSAPSRPDPKLTICYYQHFFEYVALKFVSRSLCKFIFWYFPGLRCHCTKATTSAWTNWTSEWSPVCRNWWRNRRDTSSSTSSSPPYYPSLLRSSFLFRWSFLFLLQYEHQILKMLFLKPHFVAGWDIFITIWANGPYNSAKIDIIHEQLNAENEYGSPKINKDCMTIL